MTDILASRTYRGLATDSAVEAVHNELDSLWVELPLIQDMDQMTFTTAVIESASNIVKHAEPAGEAPLEISVDLEVRPTQLRARLSAHHAKPPYGSMEPLAPDQEAESGRGLALIQALVTTVTFERQDATNTWVLSRTSQD